MEKTGFKSWLSDYEVNLYDEWVNGHSYDTYSNKTTVVVIKLKSGFEIVGTAGCTDKNRFEEALGHKYALQDALRKLDEFTAFYIAEEARRTIKMESVYKEAKSIEPFVTAKEVRKLVEETILAHIKLAHR
jgi:hypothetical protein